VKKCGKKKCAAARNRQKQLKAALKRAGESCKKGSAPDISALTKGLDKDTQGRLSRLADSQSKLFDGTTKRETKDLVPGASSLGVAVGNGSQVADLKAWDPDLNQTCPPTEFSLQSKASGEMASFKAITPTQSSPESKAAVAAAPAQNSAAAQAPAIPPCKPAGTCKPFVKSFCADKAQRLETAQAERQKILVVQKQLEQALKSPIDCHKISGGCDLLARAKACKKNYDAQLACYNKLIADLNTKCCGTTWLDPAKKQCCLNGKIGSSCGAECIDLKTACCINGKPQPKCGTTCPDPAKNQCCFSGKLGSNCGGECVDLGQYCCVKNQKFKKCGNICLPSYEYAVLKSAGPCKGQSCYREIYGLYFAESQNLNLNGVMVTEKFENLQPIDSRPKCVQSILQFQIGNAPLSQDKDTGLFVVRDILSLGGPSGVSCACVATQDIFVKGCLIQKNLITYEAFPNGTKRFTRSDKK